MSLMHFYAVTDFELSWDYIVNVGRMWWFCFRAERRFGGNYRPQLHRKINFSTRELKAFGTSEMFVFLYQSRPRQHIL
jgi:hypothetical protein